MPPRRRQVWESPDRRPRSTGPRPKTQRGRPSCEETSGEGGMGRAGGKLGRQTSDQITPGKGSRSERGGCFEQRQQSHLHRAAILPYRSPHRRTSSKMGAHPLPFTALDPDAPSVVAPQKDRIVHTRPRVRNLRKRPAERHRLARCVTLDHQGRHFSRAGRERPQERGPLRVGRESEGSRERGIGRAGGEEEGPAGSRAAADRHVGSLAQPSTVPPRPANRCGRLVSRLDASIASRRVASGRLGSRRRSTPSRAPACWDREARGARTSCG